MRVRPPGVPSRPIFFVTTLKHHHLTTVAAAAFFLLMLLCRSASAFLGPALKTTTTTTASSSICRSTSTRRALLQQHTSWRLMASATTTGGGGGPRVYEEGQDPSEVFDIFEAPTPEQVAGAKVDKLPPVKGQKKRSLVHADGDWHRAVHIWLVDNQGGLLMQRRSEFKDTFPGRWDVSCGGHIESGDESFPTAVRELEEELGLIGHPLVKNLKHLYTIAATNKGKTEKHGAFTCCEYQDFYLLPVGEQHDLSLYKFPPGEVSDIKVINYKDLEARMAANDPEYVPRAAHYRGHLWAYLDDLFAKK